MPVGNRLSLFERIFGSRSVSGSSSLLFRSSFGRTARAGKLVTPEEARRNHAVLTSVNLIADGIAQLPWNLVEESQKEGRVARNVITTDRRIGQLLRRPNGFQTPSEFKKEMVFAFLSLWSVVHIHSSR